MAKPRRPLPSPPQVNYEYSMIHEIHDLPSGLPGSYPSHQYIAPFPYPPSFQQNTTHQVEEHTERTALTGGTLLHKGFYDLLALLPSTPSPSRLFWRGGQDAEPVVAGPRYEDILPDDIPSRGIPAVSVASNPVSSPRNLKARRISKDMVSKPMGFMCVARWCRISSPHSYIVSRHLVHASDAGQAEALLSRWGPEGQGKLGGE